jgi:hypothetical protein
MLSTTSPRLVGCLLANLSAFAYDFASRQKIGGTTLNFYLYQQLPVLAPATYARPAPWGSQETVEEWLTPRVAELTSTSSEIAALPLQGWQCSWNGARRFHLRCEIDAAFLHLYGIPRTHAEYMFESFPLVRMNEEAQYGSYRTCRTVIGVYDAMLRAIAGGEPYVTALDPPPSPSSPT